MMQLGLIGKTLKHSFSPTIFQRLFAEKNIIGRYDLFELDDLSLFPDLKKQLPNLIGVNVTIPYKRGILPYVDHCDESVVLTGACNTLRWDQSGNITAFNTDMIAFRTCIVNHLTESHSNNAPPIKRILILGTGGTARMAFAVLRNLFPESEVLTATRQSHADNADLQPLTYDQLQEKNFFQSFDLIVNTTPAGMYPHTDDAPPIPYEYLHPNQRCFDVIYNPEMTRFLNEAKRAGCPFQGGLSMLHLQALEAWKIWTEDGE